MEEFEYNGTPLSLDTVTKKAKALNLSLEEFLQKFPKVKKVNQSDFQNPTIPGAVVEGTTAPFAGSGLADTSSDLSRINNIRKSMGANNPLVANSITPEGVPTEVGENGGSDLQNYMETLAASTPKSKSNVELEKILSSAKFIMGSGETSAQLLRNILPDNLRGKSREDIFTNHASEVQEHIKKYIENNYNKENASSGGALHKLIGMGNDPIDNAGIDKTEIDKRVMSLISKAASKEIKNNYTEKSEWNSQLNTEELAILDGLKDIHMGEGNLKSQALKKGIEKAAKLRGIQKDGTRQEKLDATYQLGGLTIELDKLKDEVFGDGTTFFYDNETQGRVDKPSGNTEDLSGEFKAELKKLQELKISGPEKLEMGYLYHLQEYDDNEKLLSQSIDFTPNGNNAAFQGMYLYNKGYKEYKNENGDRVFKDVTLKDLLPFSNQDDITFQDMSADKKGDPTTGEGTTTGTYKHGTISLDADGLFKSYKENAARLALERESYGVTHLMNIDPGSRGPKNILDEGVEIISRFLETATESTIGKANAEFIGTTTRKELDETQKLLLKANIPFSDKQKETFKKSFALKSAETLGHFVPELAKFAIVNYATGGILNTTGYGKLLKVLQNGTKFQKARYHFYMALMEEAKFEAVTMGEAKTGAGAGFYLGGAAFRKFMPFAFKGNMARHNEYLQKTMGGAGGMVIGSEAALVLESAVDHLEGNKEFMTAMKELYGDKDVMLERIGLSAVTGFAIGGTNLKKLDFKSIKAREQIVRDLEAENLKLETENLEGFKLLPSGKVLTPDQNLKRDRKIKENENKIEENQGKIIYLTKDIQRANDAYNKLDLKTANEKREKAEIIKNDPKSTPEQIKEAKESINEVNAQIESARKQITSSLQKLKESKALGDFEYKIQEGKEGFSDKTNQAEFVPIGPDGKPIILIDLLSYRKGVQAHEVTHLLMKELFKSSPEVANKIKFYINELVNEKLKGSNLTKGDKIKLEEMMDLMYDNKSQRPEEYITNLVHFLQNPTYRRLLIEGKGKNLLSSIRNKFMSLLTNNKIKSEKTTLEGDNLRTAQDLINFLGGFGKNIEKGRDISKQIEGFRNLKIDGDVLYDLNTKSPKSTSSTKGSKELVGVQKIRLKIQKIKEKAWIADLDGKLGSKGYKEMLAREKVLEDQIKRVEELEMNAYADELRAEIKKIENQPLEDFVSDKSQRHLEDLKLALEQKFAPAWLADAVKTAGMDIKTGDVKASKELVLEAETNIERQILKQRSGKFEGNKILQNNIDLQYNKIAMAALGFKLQKSFDARAMGLKEAEFDKALSFVNLYKDGIIKRWDPNKEGAGKFSTLVFGNIKPKRILFYEEAFGKNADVTGRITEKTKEIADTGSSTQETQTLIKPLKVLDSKNAPQHFEKYEDGLAKVDLDKVDYSNLKDSSPETTKKIFGETFKEQQQKIKNNLEDIYNLFPLSFRRMTEGTKSSTMIQRSILDNFYASGGRADMVIGTAAGLSIKAKMPFDAIIPSGPHKGKKVSELFKELAGIDVPPNRNQKTFVKAVLAEIGKAITNRVARKISTTEYKINKVQEKINALKDIKGSNQEIIKLKKQIELLQKEGAKETSEQLIQKLADGKSDVLAARIFEAGEAIRALDISDQIFKIYGGAITNTPKEMERIQKSLYHAVKRIPGVSYLILSGNLAPSGSSYKRIIEGKQTFFASNKKGFEKEIELAIKEKRILDLHALVELKIQYAPNSKIGERFKDFRNAIKSQNTAKYKNNIKKGSKHYNKQRVLHKKGAKQFLDILAEIYKINPKAASIIAYNSNANNSSSKNLAQMRGIEINMGGEKFKIREEHLLQHGQFARIAGEFAKFKLENSEMLQDIYGPAKVGGDYLKNVIEVAGGKIDVETQLKEMGEWLTESYFQISLKSKPENTPEGTTRKQRTDSHAKVDRTYTFIDADGVKQKVKLSSQLHPVMEAQIQEAINLKRRWKDVISPWIRAFNSQVAKGKGGSLNMNGIMFDGKPLAKFADLVVPKRFRDVKSVYEKQAELFERQMLEPGFKGKKELEIFVNKIAPANIKAQKFNSKAIKNDNPGVSVDRALNKLNSKQLLKHHQDQARHFNPNKSKDIHEKIKDLKSKEKENTEKETDVFGSKDLDKSFNEFLESSTSIGKEKRFSDAKGAARGKRAKKDFGDYFIPVGAEDFAGLMHKTLAKGKIGEQQLEFYQKNLYEPFNKAIENVTRETTAMANDYRALQKLLPTVPKILKKLTKEGDFTMEQAVRVAVWSKLGYEIPGLSKSDKVSLLKEVKNNAELNIFASELTKITKGDMYSKPDGNWIAGNIAMDFVSLINKAKRTNHLQVWQNNANTIFSKENLNKLEAAYGPKYRQTLERTLERMKTGQNRKWGGNATVERWNDWVNNSVGVIMFLNTKSAVLQTISSINYVNWADNNPLQAAKAFGNQKQYWKDFKEIFNSDYLKDRRGGLKINVNEAELVIAAEKGGPRGVIALLLNKGFILTRIADSFAIASGGATMLRNRLNRYKKEGMSEKEAKEKAFLDFKAITEETQQSSRADRISEQQASNLGRLLLAFANTPMQYNRIIKRNAQDLFEGRGNRADKLTKIIYYSTVQNFIFNALQKALFSLAFNSDNDEEKKIKKYAAIGEGMADSLLRGSGLTGNAMVAVKNVAVDIANRIGRPNPRFQDAAWEALTVSPPLSSKAKKLRGAGYALGDVTRENLFEPSLDNPALSAVTQTLSATINLPLDRAQRKSQNIEAAMSDEAEYWQKVALTLGYPGWEIDMKKEKSKKKTAVNTNRGVSNRGVRQRGVSQRK